MATGENQVNSGKKGINFSIQNAGWRDYSELHALEKACFSSHDVWPFWDLIGILTLPGYTRLKAVEKGMMIGFIGAERDTGLGVGWITTIATLPAYQRFGIGTSLLHACEAILDMPIYRLTVRASNLGAIALYETQGYQPIKRWMRYYSDGEDGLVFEKRR
jgi:ribosomal-protein-alanine N-acetyltransferase